VRNNEYLKSSTIYDVNVVNYIESDNQAWSGDCRNGNYQSPINIPFEYTSKNSKQIIEIYPIVITNITFFQSKILQNGGIIDLKGYASLTIKKNSIPYLYNTERLFLRYPSEHTLNGNQYDLELQIEFSKDINWVNRLIKAGSINFDPDNKNNKLIISCLFSKTGSDDKVLRELRVSTNGPILQFSLDPFIPGAGEPFFFYEGSLTYPSCDENVNWIINRKVFDTSPGQLAILMLWINTHYPIKGNSRRIKKIGSRIVYFQLNHKESLKNSTANFAFNLLSCKFLLVFILTIIIII